jgi:hypothetical protein
MVRLPKKIHPITVLLQSFNHKSINHSVISRTSLLLFLDLRCNSFFVTYFSRFKEKFEQPMCPDHIGSGSHGLFHLHWIFKSPLKIISARARFCYVLFWSGQNHPTTYCNATAASLSFSCTVWLLAMMLIKYSINWTQKFSDSNTHLCELPDAMFA